MCFYSNTNSVVFELRRPLALANVLWASVCGYVCVYLLRNDSVGNKNVQWRVSGINRQMRRCSCFLYLPVHSLPYHFQTLWFSSVNSNELIALVFYSFLFSFWPPPSLSFTLLLPTQWLLILSHCPLCSLCLTHSF